MVKIFLTGATGYIGGQALHDLYHAAKNANEISVLVRHADNEPVVLKAYPTVRIVRGDLDDVGLIEREANNADAVLHLASTKHLPSSQAIARGLAQRSTPGYWVQISGASMFSGPDIANGSYGEPSSVVYDDLRDTEKIRSIILENPARTVDHLVLQQDPAKVKTALIIGPLFYGTGQGPLNTKSIQAPDIARLTLQKGEGFRIGAGKSAWSNVHVCDLGKLFARLVDAIHAQREDVWNQNGIYAVESGSLSFGELGERIAAAAHAQGFIRSSQVTYTMTPEEANAAVPHGAVLLATNAVTKAQRAKVIGWTPSRERLEDTIAEVVKVEAERLGLRKD